MDGLTLPPEQSHDFIRQIVQQLCRLGTDADGNGYIAVNDQEGRYLTDFLEALRPLITDIKAGKADHLL